MFSIEIVAAALLSALAGTLPPLLKLIIAELNLEAWLSKSLAGQELLKILGFSSKSAVPRHKKLFSDLAETSAKMDRIVRDMEAFTKERQSNVARVEEDLRLLSEQEAELKKKVEGLRNVPLPAAEFFAKIVEEREKKNAWRDYLLFLAGVIVSAVVAIALKKLGYG